MKLRKTGAEHGFLSGYISSIYDNIYFFGGCKRVTQSISAIEYNNIRLDMDLKIDRMLSVKLIGEDILERPLSIVLIPIIKETFDCSSTDSIRIEAIETSEGKIYKELLVQALKENESILKKR
jgi:hypothetical protein